MSEPFSVLIPERGRPDMLAGTLTALRAALAGLEAECEVWVLVNGSPARDYADLRRAFPEVEWRFALRPLGFHGAMARLLRWARHPWVYLLNSDMRLHPDALRELLPWRAPDVFALASQIHFADPSRRREETGFCQAVVEHGELYLHDVPPPDDCVRAHLYAGGGASLFQAGPLRRYMKLTHPYAPFYYEDADWAMQAWAEGMNVLFCPKSLAVHEHRATVSRYYTAARIERVCARNLSYFRWRYADYFGASRGGAERESSLRRKLLNLWRPAHAQARRAVVDSALNPNFLCLTYKRFPHPQRYRAGNPRVLVVSPFPVIPPAHGGARRVLELLRANAGQVDWILLHDEAEGCRPGWPADDAVFREIHPISGRPKHSGDPLERLRAHAHRGLANEMRRLLRLTGAGVVCLEHLESLYLLDALPPGVPAILTLHDAHRQAPGPVADALRARLPRIASLVLTTAQDRGFWGHPDELVIENGVAMPADPGPSPDTCELLLVAPLRYDRNLQGVRDFVEAVWPAVRARVPETRLTVLGGVDTAKYRAGLAAAPGVEIVDGFVDPAPYYARCALALNPQQDIEGSAIKVAEALAHGRVMVTTVDGARGYEALASEALCRVDGWPGMAAQIADLLERPQARRERERQARADILPWSWGVRGALLLDRIKALAAA